MNNENTIINIINFYQFAFKKKKIIVNIVYENFENFNTKLNIFLSFDIY